MTGPLDSSRILGDRGNVSEAVEAGMQCLLCGAGERARTFTALEYLFATKEPFHYFECANCRSLQITEIPTNIGQFYPHDYYSMAEDDAPIERLTGFRRFVRAARTDFHIDHGNLVGLVIDKLAKNYFQMDWEWFRNCASTRSRILDVGCGHGNLLRKLHAQGFSDLTGIDPFITRPIAIGGLRILRAELTDLDEKFEFVMLHHSLEHMPHPLSTLSEVRRLLVPGGAVLLRLPIAGSYAERQYGINWFGLDPPRHLFVPSRTGIGELARRAGFSIQRYWCETTGWILLMSEAIARGLQVYDRKRRTFTLGAYFSESEIYEARKMAADLNVSQDGDWGCVVLRVTDHA